MESYAPTVGGRWSSQLTLLTMNSVTSASLEILARAQALTKHTTAPPVDPYLLARAAGIDRVVCTSRLAVSGQIVWNGKELVVQLNDHEPVARRNFTLLHEIGHTFSLVEHGVKFRMADADICGVDRSEEMLCDAAASEMLFPRHLFIPSARRLEPSIASVKHLAKRFGASIQSTVRRIGDTGVWPVVFVLWRHTPHRERPAALRVWWSVRPIGTRCFVPRFATIDRQSGIRTTFETGFDTCESERLTLGSLKGRYVVESARFGNFVLSLVHVAKL
jgi:hypothetical protein